MISRACVCGRHCRACALPLRAMKKGDHLFLVDGSGIVEIGGEGNGLAALSFALGFTEAAYLRLIARVANLAGGNGAVTPTPPA